MPRVREDDLRALDRARAALSSWMVGLGPPMSLEKMAAIACLLDTETESLNRLLSVAKADGYQDAWTDAIELLCVDGFPVHAEILRQAQGEYIRGCAGLAQTEESES